MAVNSHELLKNLLSTDPEARAEWERDFKLKNDPRVTSFGKFIRATSIDELPQLINVIKGEMSLVGPRPIVDEELQHYGEDAYYYLLAKPGITGLWHNSGGPIPSGLPSLHLNFLDVFADFNVTIKIIEYAFDFGMNLRSH